MDQMVNKRFGRLTVIKRVEDYVTKSGGRHARYLCACDCGVQKEVMKEYLTSGRVRSCGCLRKENGNPTHMEIHTRLYTIWGNMCNRCSNPNNPAWERYGGRGISVCDEWKKYEGFRDWAYANGYDDTLTIDRINNDCGYEPSNCRWTDTITQANNKRNNNLITYRGETKTLAEWARKLGISYKVLHHRVVGLGWEIDRAFEQPVRKSPTNVFAKQQDG